MPISSGGGELRARRWRIPSTPRRYDGASTLGRDMRSSRFSWRLHARAGRGSSTEAGASDLGHRRRGSCKEKSTNGGVRETIGIQGEGKEKTVRSGKTYITSINRRLPAAKQPSILSIQHPTKRGFGAKVKLERRGAY